MKPAQPDPGTVADLASVTEKPIGIVGLGPLGEAIARRLISANLRVVVWDSDPSRRKLAKKFGAMAEDAGSLADVGMTCDVVLATLPMIELVQAAIGDTDRPGFAHDLAPGSLLVDLGVALPSDAQRLAGLLGRGGIGLVDAPALGAAELAASGDLLLPAGGFVDFVDRLVPLLNLIGRVERAGPPGRGHALAALVTFARHAQAEAARAALEAAARVGLDAALMPDAVAVAASGPAPDDPRLAIARRLIADHDHIGKAIAPSA